MESGEGEDDDALGVGVCHIYLLYIYLWNMVIVCLFVCAGIHWRAKHAEGTPWKGLGVSAERGHL